MDFRCGGTKEKHHFERKGKLYGINPFSHCDTDCPYKEGTCISHCSGLSITQRPCLVENYKDKREMKQIKIRNQEEAVRIMEEIDEAIRRQDKLTDTQKYRYEFAKIFLSNISKRK